MVKKEAGLDRPTEAQVAQLVKQFGDRARLSFLLGVRLETLSRVIHGKMAYPSGRWALLAFWALYSVSEADGQLVSYLKEVDEETALTEFLELMSKYRHRQQRRLRTQTTAAGTQRALEVIQRHVAAVPQKKLSTSLKDFPGSVMMRPFKIKKKGV